jgi:hypothetical protein
MTPPSIVVSTKTASARGSVPRGKRSRASSSQPATASVQASKLRSTSARAAGYAVPSSRARLPIGQPAAEIGARDPGAIEVEQREHAADGIARARLGRRHHDGTELVEVPLEDAGEQLLFPGKKW